MKDHPNEDEMATVYSAIRNGDTLKTSCKILKVPYGRMDFWIRKGKKAKRKKQVGDPISESEGKCLKLYNLVQSAKRRKRGW